MTEILHQHKTMMLLLILNSVADSIVKCKTSAYPSSLADNAISNKGAKALSRALLVNRTLTSLK